MRWLKKFWKDKRGATTVMVAVSLVFLLGFSSLAIDLGYVYSTRNELQNTADAAALAAAINIIKTYNQQGDNITWSDVENAATSAAQQSATENGSLTLGAGDVVLGVWDPSTKTFTPGGDTGTVNAIRIIARRDGTTNGPITLFLGGIVGISTVNVSAEAIALMGDVGSAPEGGVTLPMVVSSSAYEAGASTLTFHSDHDDNSGWSTFFTQGGGNNLVRDYVEGTIPSPPIKVGDELRVYNGNMSNHIFTYLQSRVDAGGGQYKVTLPIADGEKFIQTMEVVGFATFVITRARRAPHKTLEGYFTSGSIPGGRPGGGNFGTMAGSVVLVR